MEYLANILAGACKSGVQYIKFGYGEVDAKLTRQNMQKCITWTKKIQKGGQALREAQLHRRINMKHFLTPVSTRFSYLIHLFRNLLYNKHMIDYLYGRLSGIHENIWARRPPHVE